MSIPLPSSHYRTKTHAKVFLRPQTCTDPFPFEPDKMLTKARVLVYRDEGSGTWWAQALDAYAQGRGETLDDALSALVSDIALSASIQARRHEAFLLSAAVFPPSEEKQRVEAAKLKGGDVLECDILVQLKNPITETTEKHA